VACPAHATPIGTPPSKLRAEVPALVVVVVVDDAAADAELCHHVMP
jgi:hypothetical protein